MPRAVFQGLEALKINGSEIVVLQNNHTSAVYSRAGSGKMTNRPAAFVSIKFRANSTGPADFLRPDRWNSIPLANNAFFLGILAANHPIIAFAVSTSRHPYREKPGSFFAVRAPFDLTLALCSGKTRPPGTELALLLKDPRTPDQGAPAMTEPTPDWQALRRRLARIAENPDTASRQAALSLLIEDAIDIFEEHPPTSWEAHFLFHAIRHLRAGFPAVAMEELTSMMKPRPQQTSQGWDLLRTGERGIGGGIGLSFGLP